MYITLDEATIDDEHICCAISDKKCREGYQLKKAWLKREFEHGHVFARLDERAKVFIEYGPAETAWAPVEAPGHLHLGCFWVSGKYKRKGHGKALLAHAVEAARSQGRHGLVTAAGKKKFHFMSDPKWLVRQGFELVDELESGFGLFRLDLTGKGEPPRFRDCAREPEVPGAGVTAYYSNRCPFTEHHVTASLAETCAERGLDLTAVKLETVEQARSAPTPATIFSLFVNGRFVTTDLSACMTSRFDKIAGNT